MRRFRFSLEAARNWRERLLQIERSKLEALFAELREIETRLAGLARARREAERVLRASVIEAQQLAALDAHRSWLAAEKRRWTALAQDCSTRIAAQCETLREAERKLRVIEKLGERRRQEWERELNREQEALAADTYIAQWKR